MVDAKFKEYSNKNITIFYQENLPFDGNEENTTLWISKIIRKHNRSISSINYIFCTDDQLHKINLKHLGHDTYTDIITFNYSDEKDIVESDIYISLDRVKENAQELGKSFDEELHRVMIHGILHLTGFNDRLDEEKLAMREKEDTCLSLR